MNTLPRDERYASGTTALQIARGNGGRNDFNTEEFAAANRVTLDVSRVFDAPGDPNPIRRDDLDALSQDALAAHRSLIAGDGDYKDGETLMLGWQDLPAKTTGAYLDGVQRAADGLAGEIDAFVSLGIGGSYLGIEATVKSLTHTHWNQLTREQRGGRPEIYFLGQNMDPDFFCDTLELLAGKRVAVNVISKSGTTIETAIVFRIFRELLEAGLGDNAKDFIVATTDEKKGALRQLADKKGYRTYVVPDNVGGRFSVLTDVGLFGIAMAGIDLKELFAGARAMRERCLCDAFLANPALVHAAVRTLAFRHGKKIEVVATNSQALFQVARWIEQIFPESEGKAEKGLWVSPSMYSEKLHANGQMVQQGERNLIETFLKLGSFHSTAPIPEDGENLDGLNYLPQGGKDMGFVNGLVVDGPSYAHYNGGVPNMTILVPARNAYCLGQIYYLMERSVAVSGTLLGVNPFDQPGVEAYKKAMFALGGKPGTEQERARVEAGIAAIDTLVVK